MRKCIFCQKAANTAEDAWPLWLIQCLAGGHRGKTISILGDEGVRREWGESTRRGAARDDLADEEDDEDGG
jgi:hypothetical protein